MRKILYAIAFLFLVVSYSYSQGRTQDVVYLKNGSVIRGLIIEQVPNKSIKVQARDESIFVYQMDEIEKLGKEEDTSYSFKKILGPKRTYDIKGYRGFRETDTSARIRGSTLTSGQTRSSRTRKCR